MIIMLKVLKHVVLNDNVCQNCALYNAFFGSKYWDGSVFVLGTGLPDLF